MDPATVLEEYLSDVMTLPADLTRILKELRSHDDRVRDLVKAATAKDLQIQKYVKQHGSLSAHQKEQGLVSKIRSEYDKAIMIQEEKSVLAYTAQYIITRYTNRLGEQLRKLDGEDAESNRSTRYSLSPASASPQPSSVRESRRATPSADPVAVNGSLSGERAVKRQRTEPETPRVQRPQPPVRTGSGSEDDEVKYCVCQRGSFGTMIACDGPSCKYEWFHETCVGLDESPRDKWLCPSCRGEL